ncbi:MAG TPA: DUF3140 domain-containing protein [Abditibacterium sp.]|jgi:hypothetical protein
MADEKHDREQTIKEFHEAVNIPATQLEKYLDSEESKGVGMTREGEKEAVGHQSGEQIVALLRKKQDEYSDDDLAQMKRVVSYVHRHLAQGGPENDKEHSRWRYSLMNWGHDPLQDA